ncbi:hypothetical protein IAR55_006371 [Kwoniella newhampshirensis]|uniref:Zn(2)-C6 fungal-type domain-containing protein n=1 Tax=Kwoniella newhampshirensis TaxID=1651941 RepID=A0AAW0YF07_9TREE
MHPIPELSSATSSLGVERLASGSTRSKLACAACRATKVRCFRGHGMDYACTRCLRYGLACTLPAVNKRRGRPRRQSGEGERATSDGTPPDLNASGSTFDSISKLRQSIAPGGLPTVRELDSSNLHVRNDPSPSSLLSDSQHQNGSTNNVDIYMSNAFPSVYNTVSIKDNNISDAPQVSDPSASGTNPNPNLDLSEYLDPADRTLQTNEPNGPFFHNYPAASARYERAVNGAPSTSNRDDPGEYCLLFHDRLNHLVAVLDRKLHTLQHLRSTSTVLFSTVLAVSSRFGRSDLHGILLSHAQTLLDRAITSGIADVGIVQAIMILMYWKAPADTSAWRKIGIAIRIGYQLYWHVPRTQPLPDDEMAARKILDVERTWMCFDRGLSQTYGLPVSIRLNHLMDVSDPAISLADRYQAYTWARDHLYLGPSVDMHLASSIELCKLKDQWRAICQTNIGSLAYFDAALDSMNSQGEALLAKWWRKDAPPPGFDYEKEHVGLWSTLDFVLILKRHNLDIGPSDPARIDLCLADTARIVDEIDILADNGDLEIMQDTESCMTSSLVVLLRKMFHLATRNQKSLIVTLLQRILVAHQRVCGDEVNTATAYVARFVRRTLRAIGTESRAGSPLRDQPINENGVLGTNDQPDFLVQLQEFMGMPEETIGTNDDEYW